MPNLSLRRLNHLNAQFKATDTIKRHNLNRSKYLVLQNRQHINTEMTVYWVKYLNEFLPDAIKQLH